MHATKCFASLALFLQVCAAVAIIVITATKFSNFQDVTAAGNDLVSVTINQSCALGQFSTGWSMCTYSYVVAGVSLAASLVLSLLLCITCNCCGIGGVLDAVFAAIGIAWWVIGAILLTQRSSSPAQLADWRVALIALAWACVALFGLALLLLVCRAFAVCCGGGRERERERKHAGDVEAAVVVPMQPAYPAYPAYASKPGAQEPYGNQFIIR